MSRHRATLVALATCLGTTACTGDDALDTAASVVVADTAAVTTGTTTPAPDRPAAVEARAASVGPATTAVSAVAGARCTTPAPGDRHEVVIWHAFGGAGRTILEEHVAEFNALGTGTIVTAVAPDNYWELLERFNTVPDAELPDIIVGNEDSIEALVASGLTLPPAACPRTGADLDDLLPVVEATYTVDGELAAVPYAVSTPVLYYDAAAFEAAGLDPADPPATLAELRATSDRIVAAGVAPHGLVAYDQYGGWLLRQGAAQRGDVLLQPANGRADEDSPAARFVSADAVDDLRWLADGVASGSFLWIGGNTGQDDFVRLIADDGGAMTLHTSASLGDLIDVMSSGAIAGRRLAVGPFPGPAPGGLVGGGALWLLDPGDAAQAGATWSFVEWLVAPARLAELDAATGYVPPRESILTEPALLDAWRAHPELRVGYDQLAAMDGGPASAGMLAESLINLLPMTNEMASRVVEGQDPASVLADIERQFQAMLDREP